MLTIRTQRYPCHDGSTPLSWAVYLDDTFLCYSWSLVGAQLILVEIENLMKETHG